MKVSFPSALLKKFGKEFHHGIRKIRAALCGMTVSEFNDAKNHYRWLRRVFIDKQDNVHFPHLDYFLTYGCNLKCEYCALFNPLRSGIVPADELIHSFEVWGQRILPEEVRILGGEPFLHPRFKEIAIAAKKIWRGSRLVVYTNAVLLPRIADDVLQYLGEAGFEIRISQHLNTEQYNADLKNTLGRFRRFGIKHEVGKDYETWMKFHSVNENGRPIPCHSHPQKAWNHCHAKHCTAIVGEQLYRCSHLLNMVLAVHEGVLGPDWSSVIAHQPMTPKNSPKEILQYLRNNAMPECTVCPEVFEKVEARQLSFEQVKQIKSAI